MKIKSIILLSVFVFVAGNELYAEKVLIRTEQPSADKNDVETVIANYVKALGGEEKARNIRNASMTAEASFQNQTIEIKTISDSEGKRLMQSTSAGGNLIQKTLLVEGKAQMIVMGQARELPEATSAMLASQTYAVPELYYKEMGFELVYIGMEELEGLEVHRLQITAPSGIIINEYYSVESGLKVKSTSGDSGDVTYSDYQEVDGFMFPMLLTIKNPMLPVALQAKVVSIKFNQTLSDSDFQ